MVLEYGNKRSVFRKLRSRCNIINISEIHKNKGLLAGENEKRRGGIETYEFCSVDLLNGL